jgi:predicted nucleic acid-binding protein
LAELRHGAEKFAIGGRRRRLEELIGQFEQKIFADNFLNVDRESAYAYGRIVAQRERLGRPISVMDALIAAVAVSHGATLATRDTSDFDHLGIDLVNPFLPT